MAARLKQPDQPDLVFRKDAGVDAVIQRPHTVDMIERVGGRHRAIDAGPLGDDAGRGGIVARHHHDPNPEFLEALHQCLGIDARRIFQGNQTSQAQRRAAAAKGHRKDARSGCCQAGDHI